MSQNDVTHLVLTGTPRPSHPSICEEERGRGSGLGWRVCQLFGLSQNERTKERIGSYENLLETTQFERGERKRKEKKEKSVHHLLNTKKKLYECDLFEF